jgi:hypothetical protein
MRGELHRTAYNLLCIEILELRAERDVYHESNERLRADNALLQGALGVQTDLVMKREAEIERLRETLQDIVRQGGEEDTLAAIAHWALEPKP